MKMSLRPAWQKWLLIFVSILGLASFAGTALKDSELVYSPFLVGLLCLICGGGWCLLLFRLGRFSEWEVKWRPLVPILALLLGAFSVALTLMAIHFTELYLPLPSQIDPHSSQPLRNHAEVLTFFIVGVGLREEGLKLLCFLPLALLLRKVKDRRIILVSASLVGLGFAAVENFQYTMSMPTLSGRFLTANALHMALTGLCGLALHDSFRKGGDEAPRTLAAAVAAHGMYDFLILYPGGKDQDGLGFFAMIIFFLVAMRWLRTFQQSLGNFRLQIYGDGLRPGISLWDRVSASSLFMTAVALSLACDLFLRIPAAGLVNALLATYMELLGSAVLIIFYLREIGENPR